VVRETVNIDHTKHGYYSIKVLNPTDINSLGAGEADLLRVDG
jgi:glutathionyl-hydroquinone reductase